MAGGIAVLGMLCVPLWAKAAPPSLRTPAPVIYLADNLDEQDRLGWCIDTVGRGFGERLHAHSCKPRGGDVQFAHDAEARRIVSATFAGKCAALTGPATAGVSLGLVDCSKDSPGQDFDYDGGALAFRPGGDRMLCLTVGAASRSAGPFMSRDLSLAPCASTDPRYRQWRVKGGRT
ncbi:MAG: hypothetical protein OYH76_02025 [Defluviicoccus sp.]|nr:hypothetical protein [Defluviicoccus sp.]MDE0274642.1 hypothetical protein [Defluviicoccus sp.]